MSDHPQIIQKLHSDIIKLEKLYSEQVLQNQSHIIEQERLESELLTKDQLFLKHSKEIIELKSLNETLNAKYENEVSHFHSESASFEKLKKSFKSKESELKSKIDEIVDKYETLLQGLEAEINNHINLSLELTSEIDDLHTRIYDLEAQHETKSDTRAENHENFQHRNIDCEDLIDDDDDDEFKTLDFPKGVPLSTLSLDLQFCDSESRCDPQTAIKLLTDHLNHSLKIKSVKKDFEIQSLRNENSQLYDYINKLLKNQKVHNANEILKEKLVKRGVLRALSVSVPNLSILDETARSIEIPKNSKSAKFISRSVSSVVRFKNYGFPLTRNTSNEVRISQLKESIEPNQNSDLEDQEDYDDCCSIDEYSARAIYYGTPLTAGGRKKLAFDLWERTGYKTALDIMMNHGLFYGSNRSLSVHLIGVD